MDAAAFSRLCELLLECARLKVRKKRAVSSEDFAEAARLKKSEAELGKEIAVAKEEAATFVPASSCEDLEVVKKQAVLAEDFAEAGRIKKLQETDIQANAAGDLLGCALLRALIAASKGQIADGSQVVGEVHRMLQLHGAKPDHSGHSWTSTASSRSQTVSGEEINAHRANSHSASTGLFEIKMKEEETPEASKDLRQEAALDPEKANEDKRAEKASFESKQALWIKVWEETWHKADAQGQSHNQRKVYKRARRVFKSLLEERQER
ncbi:unnamed protein product [Durusdinium trenchii]|uniref:Uncharacterized protein n=2 Tax=Durusdinium trenchii TaxID=1381693 RepID=A0ABP0QZ47_9DINO